MRLKYDSEANNHHNNELKTDSLVLRYPHIVTFTIGVENHYDINCAD